MPRWLGGQPARTRCGPSLNPDVAHDAAVEIGDAFTDRGVEFFEGEEATIAQTCQHPSLDDQNGDFDLRLIARLAHAGRQHDEAVVVSQILIGAIDAGLVARRLGDASLEIVALMCRSALCGRESRQPISASACESWGQHNPRSKRRCNHVPVNTERRLSCWNGIS